MPVLVGCLSLLVPRFTIILLVIFSDYIGRATDTIIWPLLGFLFMPLTTITYAWAINTNQAVDGVYLVAVCLSVLVDVGFIGKGKQAAKKRESR